MKSFFEPTGRLIMSIGKDLIKDPQAAIVELVKNSYDADASYVKITFKKILEDLIITIEDDGHGMSSDIVTGAWMVPSTDYKLKKQVSPKGRKYQGRKGLGRYAVSILGNKLELMTICNGEKTTASFDWDDFNSEKKLSEIPIDIEISETNQQNGTILTIINDNSAQEKIDEKDIENIENELSKLLAKKDDFHIEVCYDRFFQIHEKNICKPIKPLVYSDVCHYRLFGNIYSDFSYELTYKNYYTKEEKKFVNSFKNILNENNPSCGNITIDYNVYDKDPAGIELITNFINGTHDTRYSTAKIKKILKDQSGVSIFRNGFRIRPYGDPGFDWLYLDSKRVQNPSMSIGSEQIHGRISIEDEDISGLKEKSARDGLYENQNFNTLVELSWRALQLLQEERFKYRQTRNKRKTAAIERLFDFSDVHQNVEKLIEETYQNLQNNPENVKEQISKLNKGIGNELKKLEKEKEAEFIEVKEAIAIYQKHATLGNVLNVVLHEARKPLSWYGNKLPYMERKLSALNLNNEISSSGYNDLINTIQKLSCEAGRMSNLFKRLDPLSANKRKKKQVINLKEKILEVVEIFENIIQEKNIIIEYYLSDNIYYAIIEEDLYMALTNIIENAIFWVDYSKQDKKIIKIKMYSDEKNIVIEIIDNGPGVPSEDIIENLLFYPGYSKKYTVTSENGTGLGLAIAGEAVQRNHGKLEAVDYSYGGYFRIILYKSEE